MLELKGLLPGWGALISACLQLQERYPWSGQVVQVRRRDFRRGQLKPCLLPDVNANC